MSGSQPPAVDIAETDKSYEITAELPGMDEKDIEVKLSNDTLAIWGEKNEEKEEKNKDYHLSERRYGSFQRSFTVPDGVDADKIEAAFKNGVLTVSLPKTASIVARTAGCGVRPTPISNTKPNRLPLTLALGTDIGGSVRLPAAYNGIFAIRRFSAASTGPMTRTVMDAALPYREIDWPDKLGGDGCPVMKVLTGAMMLSRVST